jgi:hypothetical protein
MLANADGGSAIQTTGRSGTARGSLQVLVRIMLYL